MSNENLKDLFQDELKDLYSAEQQILKALPRLIKAARSSELREALQNHLSETEEQKQRLEQIFTDLGLPARGKPCAGMKGILEEGDQMVSDAGDKVVDAAIIAAAQKVEHYEWASYGTVRTWADLLGYDDASKLLQESLDEEQAADEKLTRIAQAFANEQAQQGEDAGDSGGGREESDDEEREPSEEAPSRGRSRSNVAVKTLTVSSRRRDRAAGKSKA